MDVSRNTVDEILNNLQVYGGVTLFNKGNEISITSIDDKEGYSYIASRNDEKFNSGKEAVKWAVERLQGVESWE